MTDTTHLEALAMRTRAAMIAEQEASDCGPSYGGGFPMESALEISDTILALPLEADPAALVAEAAKVLIPVFEEKHRAHMTAKGRNPAEYASSYSMTVLDLAALVQP